MPSIASGGDVPTAEVELRLLDLADLASVRRFAADFATEHEGLDILLNNAGVMAIPRGETEDGFEMQFGTNHLGHFALTGLLIDSLLARPSARVVTTSSHMARTGRIDFGDLHGSRRYRKWAAYSQSKLSNQLFTLELDRRARHHGRDLRASRPTPATRPPVCRPSARAYADRGTPNGSTTSGIRSWAQPAAEGALPSSTRRRLPGCAAASTSAPMVSPGCGGTRTGALRTCRHGPVTASRLWEVSARLTGVRFGRLRRDLTGTSRLHDRDVEGRCPERLHQGHP